MVVFDEHHVEQTDAMILPAAAAHRIFLKAPPTGRGLACIENFCARAFDEIGKLRRCRGHAAQALNKIKRYAFRAQKRPTGTGNFQKRRTGFHALAIAGKFLDLYLRRKFAEGEFGKLNPRHGQRFAGVHQRNRFSRGWNGSERGDVAAAEIFCQRGANGPADFCDGKFHVHKMAAEPKRKSKNHGANKSAAAKLDFISLSFHALRPDMRLNFSRCLAVLIALFFCSSSQPLFAAETNTPTSVTREEIANSYLQIQEQIHAAQLAIQQDQQAALTAARAQTETLHTRIQSLEKIIEQQRGAEAESARRTQQTTLFLAGAFGLAGLGIMLLMVYFQWRAFTQLAQISGQQHAALAQASAVHQLAAPGRAAVDASSAQLLDVVGRLEQRLGELESGQKMLPEIVQAKPSDLLSEGQRHLDTGNAAKALECFEKFLTTHPQRAEAMEKKAMALEKLGREEEALAFFDKAIAADGALVIAHLHKGALLNRLRRYDEALNCYEQALLAQEKKPVAK